MELPKELIHNTNTKKKGEKVNFSLHRADCMFHCPATQLLVLIFREGMMGMGMRICNLGEHRTASFRSNASLKCNFKLKSYLKIYPMVLYGNET